LKLFFIYPELKPLSMAL